ncbi:MAG: hypothetical protein E7536_09235 [Ruminococcaceae bacterium]|nr:hypothetical protein [Oscillospiraceae bacterium]
MKKFFVSLMALILGTTGYAVVDKTIEDRVATLESQVSELQEKINTTENNSPIIKPDPEPTHELVGTKIEIPIDSYTYTRYGYVSPEFDADAERVENTLTIHSLTATIIDVDEYKKPDVVNDIEDLTPYDTKYTIKIECNFTTDIKGEYYYYTEEYYNDYAADSDKYTYFNHSEKNVFLLDFYVNDTFEWAPGEYTGETFDPEINQYRPHVVMELADNYSGTFTKTIAATSLNPIDKIKVVGFHNDADSEIPMIHTFN